MEAMGSVTVLAYVIKQHIFELFGPEDVWS